VIEEEAEVIQEVAELLEEPKRAEVPSNDDPKV